MTICPCCGYKFEGDMRTTGCPACRSIAVGPPLARPEHELPTYGRAFFVCVSGLLLLLTFLAGTALALFERKPFSLDFWNIVASGETAAWRLKWLMLPLSLLILWGHTRIWKSIRQAPARFMGARAAYMGLASAALVALLMPTLIIVTVPERLRQRQRGIEAGHYAQAYTIQRALLEYRKLYGTLPADMKDLAERLPDPDGSIAAALKGIDSGAYKPSVDLASLPKPKASKTRPSALRRVSLDNSASDVPEEGVSFTNYELRLPGEDKIAGTDDDWVMRDGLVLKPSHLKREDKKATSATDTKAP